nr:hypothetical protein [Tanacetum cinerariifolium]
RVGCGGGGVVSGSGDDGSRVVMLMVGVVSMVAAAAREAAVVMAAGSGGWQQGDGGENSQEESYGLNDMAYNRYLEEARKKTQERNRNSKPSVMPSVRLPNTANASTPNPKRTNQTSRSLPTSKSSCVTIAVVPKVDHSRISSSFLDSKHFFYSTCYKCVFNANHDACITKLLNEVNSRKVKSHKAKNSNNPVEQKSHTQKLGRHIFSRHRFSPKKTFAVYEKTSPRYCLRWNPRTVNLQMVNPYECDQTLNVSTDTLNLSAEPVVSIGTPSSMRINQDTPSTSTSQTIQEAQSYVIPTSVEEDDHGIEVAHMDNDL